MTVEELLARYAAGERDFPEAQLDSIIVSDAVLKGINLAGANLGNAQFMNVDLSEADFRKACFLGDWSGPASLTRCNLSKANLSGANLSGVNFKEVNLNDAVFDRESIIVGAGFEDTTLEGATDFNIGEANMSSYQRTVMPDGSLEVGPYTFYG